MADVTVANTAPALVGRTLACHDANGVITATWSFATPLALQSGAPAFQIWRISSAGSGNLVVLADGTGGGLSMNTAGTAAFTGDISEKGRTTPLGHWIDVPFDAANFSTNVGAWTVDGGDITLNRYTLIGKTLIWNLVLSTTSVGSAANYLLVNVPTGTIQTLASSRAARAVNNGALSEVWSFKYSPSVVGFALVDGTNWAAAANTTAITITVILELV